MIQLAWRFLVSQKDSALARWYRTETESAGETQNNDRGAGAQVAHCPMAPGNHWGGSGWRRITSGVRGELG